MSEQARKYRIHTNTIESWVKTSPKNIQVAVRWLHKYGLKNNLSTDDIGAQLKKANGTSYSGDSVYQLLTGRRSVEQMAAIIKSVEDLEKLTRERATIITADFVETALTKRIFKVCDATRNFRKISMVIGETHIGKTEALLEYTRRQPTGSTIYFRAPTGGSKTRTLELLAEAMNLPQHGSVVKRESAILKSVDNTQIIIVDEGHQFLNSKVGLKTIDYFREVHDVTGCGIVISATEAFQKALESGEHAKWLKQFTQRSLITVKFPNKPTRGDLNDFAEFFGLPPADSQALDLQNEIIRNDSLGRWCSILEGASRIASKLEKPLEWSHVLQCHAALLDLEIL